MKNTKSFKNTVFKTLRRVLKEQTVLFGAVFMSVLFVFMSLMLYFEKDVNSGIQNYFDTFWFTIVSISTTGYGDVYPVTTAGKITGIFMLFVGVVAFGAVSGKVASLLMEINLKKEKGLMRLKNMHKHFIICGWKNDFDLILNGILAANPHIDTEQIVLINNAASERMEIILTNPRFRGIKYVTGDFTDEATLLRANIKNAERILILSDYSQNFSALEIDSRTVLAVLTIENLNPKAYVAAELIDSKFEKHLSVAHCDEIILTIDYERNLLVSASSGTGFSHVLRDLVNESSEEGMVIHSIPEKIIGKTFFEAQDYFANNAKIENKSPIAIGLLENTGNFVLRRKEALSEAQKNPNIKNVIENLHKVKNLKSNHPVLAPESTYVIKPASKIILVYSKKNKSEAEALHA